MSEELLQQLVKMVAANNRQQAEMKDMMEKMDKQLTVMENDIRDIKTYMYRIERLERQLDKTISQVSRLAVDVEILQQENN